MSSGSYFPPPVRAVEIPKPHGAGTRVLGVPDDRGQDRADGRGHVSGAAGGAEVPPDSYGYRPGSSAHDALAACRRAVLEVRLDDRSWMSRSSSTPFPGTSWSGRCEAVTDCRWVLLYVKRWLAAPLQHPDGTLVERDKGTPQGSAISPSLANLFMHYAFDPWMAREFPGCPFERYADDAVVHCKSGGRRSRCWPGSPRGWKRWGYGFTPTRRGSSIARTATVGASTSTPRLPSSGTPSGHGGRDGKDGVNFTSFSPAISPEALKAKGDRAPRAADPPAHRPVAGRLWRDG